MSAEAAEAELACRRPAPGGSGSRSGPRLAPGLDKVIPFFAFPPEVRRKIPPTNAIESGTHAAQDHQNARRFPSDEAATKLIWLALRNITADWGRAANHWKSAMNQFAILLRGLIYQIGPVRSPSRLTIE